MRKILMAMAIMGGLAAASAPAREKMTDEQRFAKLTAGLVPGTPLSCLPSRTSGQGGLTAVGPRLIYKVARNRVYVNETNGGCERVAIDDILVTESFTGNVCSGDIARTYSRASPRFVTGSCTLGRFVPYARPQ